MSRAYMLNNAQKKASSTAGRQNPSGPAAEALRRQREIFKREQQAAPVSTPSSPATIQSPQSDRSYLKEAQRNRQGVALTQAAPGWDFKGIAANSTQGTLNQNGASTKYT